jgi:2-polyprenyl-6-methoxyphenol hydroxylase-like FAD-dependent oxidoreductase
VFISDAHRLRAGLTYVTDNAGSLTLLNARIPAYTLRTRRLRLVGAAHMGSAAMERAAPDNSQQPPSPASERIEQTTCCIVGGGPGGAMLALLLARQGLEVVLLEAHHDFERAFRGDTLHASVLELLDTLGLAERLLRLRHAKVRQVVVPTRKGDVAIELFGRLRTRFPYITVMAQAQFLSFITAEAQRYPHFRLLMGAHVDALLTEGERICGVRYRGGDGAHTIRAALTVGADGRFSTVRKLAGLTPIATSSPIDVLWFRLSRRDGDPLEALWARAGYGLFVVGIDRFDYWQVGCVIPKGGYQRLRAAGLAPFRQRLAQVVPSWAGRVEELGAWSQLAVLSVEVSHLRRWHRPGLLLIGDAAHVMSPVGGVGINYAIQDAVVAANRLGPRLRRGLPLQEAELAAVQREREWPTRLVQRFQVLAQRAVATAIARAGSAPVTAPAPVRLLRHLPWLFTPLGRFIAYGLRPPRLQTPHA